MRTADDLELVGATKRYGDATAVNTLTHLFKAGRYVCLLGPSGCGKTSTPRMIAGHETVSEGAIVLGGREVSRLPVNGDRAILSLGLSALIHCRGERLVRIKGVIRTPAGRALDPDSAPRRPTSQGPARKCRK